MRNWKTIAVVATLCLTGAAHAATLSLDCNGTVHVWVDLDKSTISIWADGSNNGVDTYPAQITPTTIQWGPAKNHTMAYDDQGSLDRTTGSFNETMGPNGSWGHRGPLDCVKGVTPLPATKF